MLREQPYGRRGATFFSATATAPLSSALTSTTLQKIGRHAMVSTPVGKRFAVANAIQRCHLSVIFYLDKLCEGRPCSGLHLPAWCCVSRALCVMTDKCIKI